MAPSNLYQSRGAMVNTKVMEAPISSMSIGVPLASLTKKLAEDKLPGGISTYLCALPITIWFTLTFGSMAIFAMHDDEKGAGPREFNPLNMP